MSNKEILLDRFERLNQGRCPLHDVPLVPVYRYKSKRLLQLSIDREYTAVRCSHPDCGVMAKKMPAGTIVLFEWCERLLIEE